MIPGAKGGKSADGQCRPRGSPGAAIPGKPAGVDHLARWTDAHGPVPQNIPLVLHLLWRIDTLLLNLGLTLLVSAYYFNAEPIYPPSHAHQARPRGDGSAGDEADAAGPRATHKLLPLVVVAAVVVHSVITIAWNLGVRKLGVGAVSWSVGGGFGVEWPGADSHCRPLQSLILSLASLFAGIGA